MAHNLSNADTLCVKGVAQSRLNLVSECLAQLMRAWAQEYGPRFYEDWFAKLHVSSVTQSTVTIVTPTKFVRDFITQNYFKALLQHFKNAHIGIETIDIRAQEESNMAHISPAKPHVSSKRICSREASSLGIVLKQQSGKLQSKQAEELKCHTKIGIDRSILQIKSTTAPAVINIATNRSYTFEHFVQSPENKLAYNITKQVAIANAGALTQIPIFKGVYIYSSFGMGKTHLLQAVAHHINKHQSTAQYAYFTAEKFTHEYVQAVKTGKLRDFKALLSKLDLLMLDDFQLICTRKSTAKEFIMAFDALIETHKCVLIAADRVPHALDLDDRIKSRLAGCLAVQIEPLQFESKLRMLQHLAKRIRENVTDEILSALAKTVPSSVRELESALYQVVTYRKFMGVPLTLEIVERLQAQANNYTTDGHIVHTCNRSVRHDLPPSSMSSAKTNHFIDTIESYAPNKIVDHILNSIVRFYKVDLGTLISRDRTYRVARARRMAAYLIKDSTPLTLRQIGLVLGHRHHATILALIRHAKKEACTMHIYETELQQLKILCAV